MAVNAIAIDFVLSIGGAHSCGRFVSVERKTSN
jgi:hypothetical protein